MEQKRCISSLTLEQLDSELKALGQPGFRAKQIFHWVHQKLVTEFSAMTDQPKTLLAKLEEHFYIAAPQIERRQEAKDGTVKYLLRMADGNCIETVVMRYHYGNTVCVSTQVGCRMGCRFCASTQAGRVRNLEAGEICSEIYTAQKDIGERISHIVLMGIGEPLDNFDEVMRFLENITSPEGVNIGMRNISLSTCGLVPKIDQLAEKKLQLTLSVSLHAPNNEIRSGMMPVNDAYPVEQLMQAVRRYQDTTGRRVSFEYSMVRGVNDSDACAKQLANLIRGMGAHVNLIPINPVDGSPYSATDAANVRRFQQKLESLGVNATVRRRLGSEISAACGQLRRDEMNGKACQKENPMKLAGKTDVGRVRQENQDDYRAGELPGGAVWALVCDGMGGAKGGREASQGACNVIENFFQEQYAQCGAGQEEPFLKKALLYANRFVFQKAAHEEALAGMGTTAVCALVRSGNVYLCHAGDSRAYLIRDGKLTQLTHDHSYVQELVDCGTITEEEAEHHPQKNIITKALGVDYRLEPEFTAAKLKREDRLLLCTDGLTNMVPVEEMEELLAQGAFYDLPDRLIEAANAHGGSDNITALLLAVEPTEVEHG